MSNLERVQNLLEFFEVCDDHNRYVINKLKELEQGIINELNVEL